MPDSAVFRLKAPARQTLGDSVAGSIRAAILEGMFKPGQRLAEAHLASSLKVSRAPVREALANLEQEGLVHRTANGATIVTRMSQKDAEEICSLRLILEVAATQQALEKGSEHDWELMAANVQAMQNARDADEQAQLDLGFHELNLRASHHSRLLACWSKLRSQIRLILLQRNLCEASALDNTVRHHSEILRALQRREKKAVALIEKHLQDQYDWIPRIFARSHE